MGPRFAWVVGVTWFGCRAAPGSDRAPDPPDETDTLADTGTAPPAPAVLEVASVDPPIVDPLGGSHLTITGIGFLATADHPAVTVVEVGGVALTGLVVLSDTAVEGVSAPVAPGPALDVVARRGADEATLAGAVLAWSPAELVGARLFDAAAGVTTEEPVASYEWQRLTPELDPDWGPRDGNTLTWLPGVGRFVMVAGWDPYGFDYTYNVTTDEVWSSPDGVAWTRELAHGNGAFERRHSHNTVLWNDELWMVGGDTWQGFYNHDVVSSPDGVSWTVQLGPGAAADPPWSERALQTIGVYDGKLWMAGGQDLFGDPADYTFHNDVWNTEDGVNWTLVAADGPASDTRWAGCGVLDGLVEFRGELWLVGCAREREDAVGHSMSNEVWSTTDGVTWRLHAEPPWVGKIWPNVVVWDDKLWILFGYTYGDIANGWNAGNSNEAWYSEDGETWASLRPDAPVPGSHAQGVAVTDDFLLLAGGNYNFGFGAGLDLSSWRLVPFHGDAVRAWTDRGEGALTVSAADDDARPVLVPDAFGPGRAGLQFDGSTSVLALDSGIDEHPEGYAVFWVARASHLPQPWAWEETYAPLGTIVGGPVDYGWMPRSSVGLSGGEVTLLALADERGSYGESLWTRVSGGSGLQPDGAGSARMAGMSHAVDGAVQFWVDGLPSGAPATADRSVAPAWSRVGGSLDDDYYGPHSRFAGTLGAVVVLSETPTPDTVDRLHQWARGRFGVP